MVVGSIAVQISSGKVGNRSYVINEGEIISHGTPEEILQDENARKFYLGDKFRM